MAITIDGTNGLTTDNAALKLDGTTLVVDDTNNYVGIGTSSPACKTDVAGVIRSTSIGAPASGAGLELSYGGTANTADILAYDRTGAAFKNLELRCSNLIFNTGGGGERMRITSDGYLRMASGTGGIQFGGDTAAANALDDYEEGSFTPTAVGGSSAGTTTYILQQGSYTKIGRCVTVSIRLEYSSMTGSGNITIGGLPFTTANDSMEYIGAMMVKNLNWGGGSMMICYMPANSSNAYLYYSTDDADWQNQQCVNESAGFRITLTYFV